MKFDGKKIGNELRALRIRNNIPAEKVCKDIDIHISTLYKCERDASRIKLGNLEKLLNYYGIDTLIFFKMISAYENDKGE